MGVVSYEIEFNSKISPARLFKAIAIEPHKIFSKAEPQVFKSVELQGDCGPGTILTFNYHEDNSITYTKKLVEMFDQDNLSFNYSVIEGGFLGDKLKKLSYENKFVATANGGSIIKVLMTYYTTGDSVYAEEEHKVCAKKNVALYKAVESYLIANPDACKVATQLK